MKQVIISIFSMLVLLLGTATNLVSQSNQANDIVGKWLNEEGTAQVEIFKVGSQFYGKIVWLETPNDSITGLPRTDKENPDPALKSKPLLGLVNLQGFVFDGDDTWEDGTIYDPKIGKTYSCKMEFETPEKLKIRGYIGISLLGRTTYWTPVKK
jgi:uncharacterized protein (DUF2147 family)